MNALAKNHRRSFTILLFLFCHAFGYSQLTANFTATPLAGCSPLVVRFTDVSNGNPTQWKWDLGNGVSSLLQNPSATYFNPGTYTIKLIIRNVAGSADSITRFQYITVYAAPTVAFIADKRSGCFPLRVNFTDQSIAGEGTIAAWFWDFGDGNTSTQQTPNHTYTTAGNYNVTLKVTNSFGCTKTFSQPQYIMVAIGVTAAFTNTDPGACPPPSAVQFTNATTGPGPLTYAWDFGDGATRSVTDPGHLYTAAGSYSVMLIATSPQGCTDTIRKPNLITIGTINTNITVPDTVCVNESVSFTNGSSPTPVSCLWSFGNGNSSTSPNPVTSYTSPGSYTVTLVNNFGGCSDSAIKKIYASAKPAPVFDADKKVFCSIPVTVSFVNQTAGTNAVYWDFGDSTTSTQNNPSHTYASEGSFTVTLIATNAAGCSDTLIKTNFITIQKPQVAISGLPRSGCTPITIRPTAVIATSHSITNYLWNFGDGTASASPNPSHTYTATGTYTVSLVYTTLEGCTDSVVFVNAIRTGTRPRAAFTNSPTNVCAFQPVSFQDASTGPVTQWLWDFGDGGNSTLQNPLYQYQDTGWFNVQLIVVNNTCPDTIRIMNAVHIKPPIARFNFTGDCNNKFTKTFVDTSVGATSWFWNFGDGTTSTQRNNIHTYIATGTYSVTLTVSNDTCSHSVIHAVSVIDEKAVFATPDTIICRNQAATFTSVNINRSNIASWYWNFGDGTASNTDSVATHVYISSGTYKVTLIITDSLGCKDSISLPIKVHGTTANFSASVAVSCLLNNDIAFTDLSTTDGIHPIVNWIWNYGDGVIDSAAISPYHHSYVAAGSYTISLLVKDNFGCEDLVTKPASVLIAQPIADFFSPDTVTCVGKPIAFNNLSAGINPQYVWNFGDGNSSGAVNPSHNYGSTGLYTIKLLVTDQYGCKDSLVRPDYIAISYPKARFTVSDSAGTCPPLLVDFFNASTDYTNKLWNFGDGSTSILDSPSHFYTMPGTYYATLTVKGPGGCTDVAIQKIVIKGPSGSFTYTPLTGCKPLTVSFAASTKNNAIYTWDFADGTIVVSPDSIISHTYTNAGDFTPKIILTDVAGCSVPIVGPETIRVSGASAGFTLGQSSFCNDGTVQFTNTTVGNDFIISYDWNFGDGAVSTAQHPSHYYASPGLYTVSLNVLTQNGCTDSLKLIDTIKVYRNPIISIAGGTSGCSPLIASFNSNVTVGNPSKLSWLWNFGNGQTDTNSNPSSQLFTAAGIYTVTAAVVDDHGCNAIATKLIEAYAIPVTDAGADLYVCQGSFVQLKASGAYNYVWKASPSLSCTTCANPLAAPNDSTVYTVTGSSQYGCSSTDSVFVRVHYPFTLRVEKGDTICVGKTVPLKASGAQQYTWIPATGVTNPTAASTMALPAVSTIYKVIAKDNAGCFTDTGYVNIKVWQYPKVDAGADKTVSIGSTFLLQPTYSTDIIQYQWNNPLQTLSCVDCPAPTVHTRGAQNTYAITVKNNGGCVTTDEITVYAICNGGNLFIPNTFSPNADGKNERFYPRGSGIGQIKSLRIYNRWGEVVFDAVNFSANNTTAGWDGTYKGKALPPDVYVYTCEVVCMNNEVLSYKGDVTLLR